MILHIPHSSTFIPHDIRSTFPLADEQLQSELLHMTDWFTDELFGLADDTVKRLVYGVSRLVCDPERYCDDALEPMASKGMGVIYTKTSDGRTLRGQLSADQRQHLIDGFYIPHHAALESGVRGELDTRGFSLIVDCHSFSSVPLPHEPDQDTRRPDLCIGTDTVHTPSWLVETIQRFAASVGWTVSIDRPFSGTIVPAPVYANDARVLSVMLELNRKLYMDQATGVRTADFQRCRDTVVLLLADIRDNAERYCRGLGQ